MPIRLRDFALFAILATTLPRAGLAAEAELCVACNGPPAVYRCLIELPAGSKSADARAQMVCATELATAGGHESCSVSRVSTAPCEGPVRAVKMPASPATPLRETLTQAAAPASPTATVPVAARELPAPTAAEPPAAAKPEAPGKSAWTCVASFFKDC